MKDIRTLYEVIPIKEVVSEKLLNKKNRFKQWKAGYDRDHDIVIISSDGTLGSVVEVQGLQIGLPLPPKEVYKRSRKQKEQYWEKKELPKELTKIKSVFEWDKYPDDFKNKWVDLIEQEFNYRENGYWFKNNGVDTYITGSHYFFLQYAKIDVGAPDYRESNRIFYYFWEACKLDTRCFGLCYLKNRRSGFSFMAASDTVNMATISSDARFGILSKTGADAKKLFTDKVVPISVHLPFFFKPIQDGSDRPKTELSYKIPAAKLTRKSIQNTQADEFEGVQGLDTTIDHKNTGDNSYDGEKLKLLVHDECYHPDTLIMNDNMDFVPVKSLKVGDKVMVEGGIVKTIMKRTEGETDRYLVKQPYGRDYIVTQNHRLMLKDRYSGKHKEVTMTPPEYLDLSEQHKRHITRVTSKGIEAEDKFEGLPPYMLGLWLGDGRYKEMTILVNKDREPELLYYLERMAYLWGVEYDILERKKCKADVIEFRFKGINDELRKIGVYGNKHTPEDYLKSSIDARLQLLAGFIDSDGYSDKKKGSIEFCLSKKHMIEQVRFIALSCGLSCSEVMHKKTNYNTDAYRINISGELSMIPCITHKKWTDYKPQASRRSKMDIEHIGVGAFVGIQVDADNDDERSVILSDFTLTKQSGKWEKPNNILNNWTVTQTCLLLGRKIVGKAMMGSTSNKLDNGGQEFKDLYYDSDLTRIKRNKNGRTPSGLYAFFINALWNMEGFFDRYGAPVFEVTGDDIDGIDGEPIDQGVEAFWDNTVEGLKHNPDAQNEYYRQFPLTEKHAFRDDVSDSLFNLTKIYEQIDWNEELNQKGYVTTGAFQWKNGVKDSEVEWHPSRTGRFKLTWIPPIEYRNKVVEKDGVKHPANMELGAFGCDSYDISGTVGGGGSNGALHGLTAWSMYPNVPNNMFFLEYVARPQTAEIFFEDVLMACVFYGMPLLCENNKPRLLYHFKRRGYRGFSMNRPDKTWQNLSKTEQEIGGIPNSSEDIKQAHASAIEAYIENHVGLDQKTDEMGKMYFNRTLEDWVRFDITKRTAYDASISSGLAIMACQRKLYRPTNPRPFKKIDLGVQRYRNTGIHSRKINV